MPHSAPASSSTIPNVSMTSDQPEAASGTAPDAWHAVLHRTLKANAVRLFAYVPDRFTTPLIRSLHADPEMPPLLATGEEEAVGVVSGAWMAGMRGVLAMQTSGF